MLRYVRTPTRIVTPSLALAGALFAALLATSSASAGPAERAAVVKPTTAASSTTRRVAHVRSVHHRRHAHAHRTEPSLRAREVTAASLPMPARAPKRPRTSHRGNAIATGHRDVGARANGAAGMPVSAAGALSIAVLGACVHQRHRLRLRSVSQPLESRGPPRAGPLSSPASRRPHAARESSAGIRFPHPLLAGSPPIPGESPLGPVFHTGTPRPAPRDREHVPLERPHPPHTQRVSPAPARFPSRFPLYGAPGPTRSARSRAAAPHGRSPRTGGIQMKRIPAVLVAVVAMAFAATVALADTTAPTTTPAPAKSTTHHSSKSSSKATHPKTDLNTASKEDLMKLPGVDDALADKIVAARPFKSRTELESKNIVTKEQYSKLSPMVTVAPPQKTASK
jgi:hypothetical protein